MGIYYTRQLHFKVQKDIRKYDLEKKYKTNNHYKVLSSQSVRKILSTVAKYFKYYHGLVKAYKIGKITNKPRIISYSFNIPMPNNFLNFSDIKKSRILSRNKCFYFESIYKKEVEPVKLNQDNILGIDPEIVNWSTYTSTREKGFIIDGKQLKSINR